MDQQVRDNVTLAVEDLNDDKIYPADRILSDRDYMFAIIYLTAESMGYEAQYSDGYYTRDEDGNLEKIASTDHWYLYKDGKNHLLKKSGDMLINGSSEDALSLLGIKTARSCFCHDCNGTIIENC